MLIVQTLGLKMSDLFIDKPEKPPKKQRSSKAEGKIEKVYQYEDLSGSKVLFEVVRYRPKAFKQRRPDGRGGYIYNLKGVETVIFRLPQITAAVARGETVYHAEGEKDVLSIVSLGLEATTSPMGANSWKSSYAKFYTGASQVVIFPDKDEAGRAYAHNVAMDIYSKVEAIKIVELPGENVKDFSDWLAAGGTRAELEKLIENTPPWLPQKADTVSIDYDSMNHFTFTATNPTSSTAS